MNALLHHEETYWKQRAKIFRLAEGDSNSRFFHAAATTRKKANFVDYLVDDSVKVVSSHEGMCVVVKDYFTRVFEDSDQREENVVISSEAKVTASQNRKLTKAISFDEFTTAFKQMHPDKVSGPDGLNHAFF